MSADTIVILLNGAITVGALLWAGGKGSAVLARLAGAVDKLADKVAGHEGRILVLEDRHYRPDRERDRPQ